MKFAYSSLPYSFLQMPDRSASWPARFGVAIFSTGLTLITCLLLQRYSIEDLPLTLFVLPIAASAWYSGLRAGLLATLLSSLASNYFLLAPRYAFSFSQGLVNWERMVLFMATGALISWLIESMRAGRRDAELRAREAEQRQSELEAQIAERERAKAERERLIAELETERARFKAVVEHIPAGILMAEAPSGRIIMGNPQLEKILGHPLIPSANVESYREWTGFHADGRRVEGHEYPLARALHGEVVIGEEVLYQRGDDVKAWIRISGAPIRDDRGRIVGGVALITDIDQEKRVQEAFRQ